MHPDFLQTVIHDHERALERSARRAYVSRPQVSLPAVPIEPVVLRLCSVHDDEALERLAALEGRPAPTGRFVVAEVGGTVVAALPLGCGPVLADPFRRTTHLLPLLELRARQLTPPRSPGRALAVLGAVRSWGRA